MGVLKEKNKKMPKYIVYAKLSFEVEADKDGKKEPEVIAKELAVEKIGKLVEAYKEDSLKVEEAKLADKASGYFV